MCSLFDYINEDRYSRLQNGTIETKNFLEIFSIDIVYLLRQVLPSLHIQNELYSSLKITKKMQLLAELIYQQLGFSVFFDLMKHTSDIIRGLACYLLAFNQNLSLIEKITLIKPLADDTNYSVREWAWIALRKNIAEKATHSIMLLTPFAQDASPYIRRFASEATRPRGVWSTHIRELRENPWYGLPILEELMGDSSRYVQLSVGNWLNDAGKDHPEWVQKICSKWLASSTETLHTAKICKRALRNIHNS